MARTGRVRGFSLIELLVVIVIIGVVSAGVTLAVGGNDSRRLEQAAEQLQALMQLACERASLSGVDVAMRVNPDGLAFGPLLNEPWQAWDEGSSDELRARRWSAGVQVSGATQGRVLDLDEQPPRPQWACFATGEASPVQLTLRHPGTAVTWLVEAQADGRVERTRQESADAR